MRFNHSRSWSKTLEVFAKRRLVSTMKGRFILLRLAAKKIKPSNKSKLATANIALPRTNLKSEPAKPQKLAIPLLSSP